MWNLWTLGNTWEWWIPYLPKASVEPQKLELLGSVKVKFCVKFDYSGKNQSVVRGVSPHHPVYKNQTFWCNDTSVVPSTLSSVPLQLPQRIFFVCGDRAWSANRSNIKGGPCSLGKLTLLTPSMKMITSMRHRGKRSFIHQYGPECKDDFES